MTENVSSVPRSTDLLGADPIISNGIKVLGVGQTGDFYPSPLQQAVLNLLDTAEHSVYLSQQSLIHPYYELLPSVLTDSQLIATLNDGIAHRLVEKAIGGLDVKVVLSNRVVPHDTGSYIANEDLLALVWKRAVAQDGNLDSRTNRNKFCQNFGLYHLRVDKTAEVYPGSNLSFANHSKSILVDKELFLIGSHNLYEQDPSELSEFSFVVADRTEARKYYDDYWQPVLDESGRTGFDPVRCYTILKNAS